MILIDTDAYRGLKERRPRTIVVLGNFDGCHIGHARLLRAAREKMDEYGAEKVAVWTFSELPRTEGKLSSSADRFKLLGTLGADFIITDSFERVRFFTPERFVSDILSSSLGALCCVCGYNYRFGCGGEGDAARLSELCGSAGIGCVVVPEVRLDGRRVSSSNIRELILRGRVDEAAELLGRDYEIGLPVLHGERVGTTMLGFPTANQIIPKDYVRPANGVYVTSCEIDGFDFPCMTNVGVRPTFENSGEIVCETHIIGYSGNLYGRELRVKFFKKLRDEMKFESAQGLREQLGYDLKCTKEYFEKRYGK